MSQKPPDQSVLLDLSPANRYCLGAYYDGLTAPEIAGVMGCGVSAVRQRLGRLRRWSRSVGGDLRRFRDPGDQVTAGNSPSEGIIRGVKAWSPFILAATVPDGQ